MEREHLKQIIQLRHKLHAHPELSYQEIWTKKVLEDFLRKNTSLQICDQGKWLYAYKRGKSGCQPAIAFRADFDAVGVEDRCGAPYASQVPGVGHQCGHDGHSAALAGLAMELSNMETEQDVYLIFQHAEETGQGAKECAGLIKEKNIGEIYAFHNSPEYDLNTVMVRDKANNCASTGMIIDFTGTTSHASRPENGRNPAFAIARIISTIPELTQVEAFRGIVLCTVVHVRIGEPSFGVSPGRGVLMLTVRGQYEAEMNALTEQLERMAQSYADEYRLQCEVTYRDFFPETINSPRCAEKVRVACNRLGIKHISNPEITRGSEDFGHFLKETDGAIFNIGDGKNRPPLHTTGFDFPDEILETAVEIFKQLISISDVVSGKER